MRCTVGSADTSAIVSPMTGPGQALPRQRDAEKRSVLRNHYLFGKLNREGTSIAWRPASSAKTAKRASTIIFAKGDPGTSLFAICRGAVKITVPSIDGHDAVFNLIGKGDIFGEIALLDGRPRTADAIAITDCELFVIERRDFLPLVREEPEIALKLIEILCARLRPEPPSRLGDLMFLHLPGRLAKAVAAPVRRRRRRAGALGSPSPRRTSAASSACPARKHQPAIAHLGTEQVGSPSNAAASSSCPPRPWNASPKAIPAAPGARPSRNRRVGKAAWPNVRHSGAKDASAHARTHNGMPR